MSPATARRSLASRSGRRRARRQSGAWRLAHLRPEVVAAALDRVGAFGVPETPVILTGLFVARLAEAVATAPADY